MQTFREAYLWASSFLKLHNTKEPAFETELLLRKSANLERHQLFLQWDEKIQESAAQRFEEWIEQRAKHVPIQYIIGEQEFYGRPFYVDSRVLIPRPETEQLVEQALKRIKTISRNNPRNQSIRILDIGTGSGIIPITLALEMAEDNDFLNNASIDIDAVDISAEALAVAQINGTQLFRESLKIPTAHEIPIIRWFEGDTWPSPCGDNPLSPYDMILSNPPYIDWSEEEQLDKEVKDYEPQSALFADDQGLAIYKKIIIGSSQYLKQGGYLGFEIGYQQGRQVKTLLIASGFEDIEVYKDLAGHQRIIFARKSNI